MKTIRLATTLLLLSMAAACSTNTRQSNLANHIAECNAGANVKMSADLKLKIEDNMHKGLHFSAGIEKDIRGHFLNSANVSEENAVRLYDLYNQCMARVKAGG